VSERRTKALICHDYTREAGLNPSLFYGIMAVSAFPSKE
jgi:hypothetical protein